MIIVTGGAGFIGSALVWGFNEKGFDDLLIVDHLESDNKWKNLVKRSFQMHLGIDKLLPWLQVEANKRRVEAIFHIGACSSTVERDMDFLLANNVDYTMQLFRYCANHQIPLIYASSAATYGMGEHGFADDPIHLPKLRPINPYGYSKQLVDRWVLESAHKPFFWCGLKFFNVYGPGEYHKKEMMSLVAKAYPQVQSTGRMKLFQSHKEGIADGQQKRDFIYIKDVVKIMLHIWEHHKTLPSGIYNVGTGKAQSFFELGQAMFKAMDRKAEFDFVPMPQDIRSQYQYFTEAKTERLRNDLKYMHPMHSVETGVGDYVRNYLSQEDCYL